MLGRCCERDPLKPGYIISDQPMTEEQWAKERATVIDAEPAVDEKTLPKD